VNIEIPPQKSNGKLTRELFEAAGVAVTTPPAAGTKMLVPAEESGFSTVTLDELADRVRNGCRKIENLRCNALHALSELQRLALPIAIDMGNAINEAQGRLTPSDYKVWFHTTCRSARVAPRTAKLFQQLARSGDVINAEIMRTGEMLSIRAARRLISKSSKPTESTDEGTNEDAINTTNTDEPAVSATESSASQAKYNPLEVALNEVSDKQTTAAFAKRTPAWFLTVMPKGWIPELTGLVANLPRAQDEPFIKASEVLRNALSAVAIASAPKTTPAVALSQEKVALTALRSLNFLLAGAGIDEVTIVRKYAKESRCVLEKRRRGGRGKHRA
jgi:hypothetical protein